MTNFLPAPAKTGRPREHANREILNAIFYIMCCGCAWRRLPHDLPPWKTVYTYFRRSRKDGAWERINTVLREALREQNGRAKQPSAAILDLQSVKTVEGGAERGYDAGKHVTGRKRHLVVDTLGLVLMVVVTAASVQDRDGARELLHLWFLRVKHSKFSRWCRLKRIWADGSYRGELIGWAKQHFGWILDIVERPADPAGFQVLPKRWIVERTYVWLNRHRRLSIDYEHLPETSEAFVYIAMIRLMLKQFVLA